MNTKEAQSMLVEDTHGFTELTGGSRGHLSGSGGFGARWSRVKEEGWI